MPGLQADTQPLIDPTKSFPTDISRATARLRATSWALAEPISTALENLQNNANQMQQALRKPASVQAIIVRDTLGQVIAQIGPYESGAVQTSGGMFAEMYIGFPAGVSDPAQAKLTAKPDGTFTISGATSIDATTYKVGGTAGLSVAQAVSSSITPTTGTVVTAVSGPGVSSVTTATGVLSIAVTTKTLTFSSGILLTDV